MISKVKTLNPKTKGQTIKEKGNRNEPEMETLSVGHNIQPAVPTSSAMKLVNLILHIHS